MVDFGKKLKEKYSSLTVLKEGEEVHISEINSGSLNEEEFNQLEAIFKNNFKDNNLGSTYVISECIRVMSNEVLRKELFYSANDYLEDHKELKNKILSYEDEIFIKIMFWLDANNLVKDQIKELKIALKPSYYQDFENKFLNHTDDGFVIINNFKYIGEKIDDLIVSVNNESEDDAALNITGNTAGLTRLLYMADLEYLTDSLKNSLENGKNANKDLSKLTYLIEEFLLRHEY